MVNEKLIKDQELLTQLAGGVDAAFEKIYRLYSSSLYFKLLNIVKSRVYADEILQDVFLVIWERRAKIDPTKCFQSYINCIAVNKCYDHFRKIARDKKLAAKFIRETSLDSISESRGALEEQEETINDMIEKLPPKRRLIFKLCKLDGKSYEEVSTQLGVSLSTISDHIVKANIFIRRNIARAAF